MPSVQGTPTPHSQLDTAAPADTRAWGQWGGSRDRCRRRRGDGAGQGRGDRSGICNVLLLFLKKA